MVYTEPSGSLEFWYMLEGFCVTSPQWKTLGTECLMSFPFRPHWHVVKTHCWRNVTCPGSLYWEKTLGSLLLVSSGLCPSVPFPFADFAVYLFLIIDLSPECNYMLSPVGPSSKSLSLGWSWGLWHKISFIRKASTRARTGFAGTVGIGR